MNVGHKGVSKFPLPQKINAFKIFIEGYFITIGFSPYDSDKYQLWN
jgi:hypothetical protein